MSSHNSSWRKCAALNYTEVLILVFLAILILATAVGISLQSKATELKSTCIQSLREVSRATLLYMEDNENTFPIIVQTELKHRSKVLSTTINWRNNIEPYTKFDPECPESLKDRSFPNNFNWGYGLNYWSNKSKV